MDGTYAPQSPDLSGFTQQPQAQAQAQPYHQSSNSFTNQSTSYAPRSPVIPSYSYPTDTPPQPIQFNHNYNLHAYPQNQSAFGGRANDFEYGDNQYMPPIPDLPPSHSFQNAPLSNPNPNPNLNPNLPPAYYQNQQQQTRIPEFKNEASFYNHNPDDYISSPTMSSRGPRIKSDPSSSMSMSMAQLPTAPPQQTYKNPNPLNIEIKTKFPVARIKRIMQADEEVGKVAQVTPVAVSKALELFMISLVSSAADVAKEKGQKRVTAQHLKAVVLGAPEQFDFLAEIVGRVSEAQEGAGGEAKKRKGVEKEKEKAESESSEEEKKPKKGRGRRKKSAD